MYFGNHKISKNWGLHSEYQWRRHGLIETWQQSLMRLGLDYYTGQNSMITAGYGWIVSYPYGDQAIPTSINEHRIWQQLILKNQVGRFYFQHRYRLEERFIESRIANSTGAYEFDSFNYKWRGRYRFLSSIPLNRNAMDDVTLFLAIYDEVFIGFGKGIGANVLDQNRLFAALGWRFNSDFNIQLGYLNQFVFKADGQRAERNHTLQAALTYNIDFRKQISLN